MPLTMQLYGSSPDSPGHLFIDRKNLIIGYNKSDDQHQKIALKNRERIARVFNSLLTRLEPFLSTEESYAMTSDPRHDALEHMSSYDRSDCLHYHLIFQNDINFKLIELIFENFPNGTLTDLISNECIAEILEISKGYFDELSHSSSAKAIEDEYRQQKDYEFKKATPKKAQKATPTNDGIPITINITSINDLTLGITLLRLLGITTPTIQMPLAFFNQVRTNSSPRIVELLDDKRENVTSRALPGRSPGKPQ